MLARFGILPALASKAGSIGMGNPEQSMDTLSGLLVLAVYPLMLRSRSGARAGAGAFCLPEKTHYSS